MRSPVLVIVGPTAAGKSRLAMACATELGGEIVSADSVQVYQGLDIGSAKASCEDQAAVRHWCIDLAPATEALNVAAWTRFAQEAIDDITKRGRVPIVVGGTGFYIRSLFVGLHDVPPVKGAVRAALRAQLAEQGPERLFLELQRVDPVTASRLHPTDGQRIGRALEVFRSSGQALSTFFEGAAPQRPLRPMTFGLWPERPRLYERIGLRAAAMVKAGLVKEVRGLLQAGVPSESGPLRSLGYRQVVGHLAGEICESDLVEAIATGHRHYARRQLTWFRGTTTRDQGVTHLDPATCDALDALLTQWHAS